MAYVIFDGNKIQPAPYVNIEKTYSKTEDGQVLGSLFNLTLNGYILPYKGSPNSSGVFWTGTGYGPDENINVNSRLTSILAKQKALMTLFSSTNNGKVLEIYPDDASQPMKCNPNIENIVFTEDIWFNFCRYSISLTANDVFPYSGEVFTDYIVSASENWSIDTDETPENEYYPFMFRVSHALSAQGKRRFDATGTLVREAWEEAKNWCVARLGYNQAMISSSGVNWIDPSLTPYNHYRSESIDKFAGAYSVNETWLLSRSGAIEDFSVSVTSNNSDGLTNVSIEGNIQGLESKTSGMTITETKYNSALEYYNSINPNIFSRAQNYSQITLNPIPVSTTLGKNPVAGTINYSYEYNNRPTALISGALSETISVTINDTSDKYAAIPVLGRPHGPVLQTLNTSDEKRKTLSIEAVFGPSLNLSDIPGSFEFPYNRFETLVDLLNPINNGAVQSFMEQPSKTWEPITGRANLQISWVYET